MARPDTLPQPWASLADRLGGAMPLYEAIQAEIGVSLSTAKRLARDKVALGRVQWVALSRLFERCGVRWQS